MKLFLGYLLMAILAIAAVVSLIQVRHHKANIERCEKSQYKTKDYEITKSHKLSCRSSDNSFQILTVMELDKINKGMNDG